MGPIKLLSKIKSVFSRKQLHEHVELV